MPPTPTREVATRIEQLADMMGSYRQVLLRYKIPSELADILVTELHKQYLVSGNTVLPPLDLDRLAYTEHSTTS